MMTHTTEQAVTVVQGYVEAEAMLRDLLLPNQISDTAIRVARDHMMQFKRLASVSSASAELEAGKDELRCLMDSIWRAEYRKEAPDWSPLDDLPGMVSQIDNMYAGVRGQRDQARWDLYNSPASPEPVPATNQAGEVERIIAALKAERAKPLQGPEHGAWDRGRRYGLDDAIRIAAALAI